MPQLVGRDCVICCKSIVAASEAKQCPSCGNSVHSQCMTEFEPPAQTTTSSEDPNLCLNCGGDRATAPATAADRRGGLYPEHALYAAAALILLGVVFLIWPVPLGDKDIDADSPDTANVEADKANVEADKANVEADKANVDGDTNVPVSSAGNPMVEIETSLGTIQAELFQDKAPETVGNFVELVEKRFYDGIVFHRVIKEFMIQTGDPLGQGTGGRTDKGLPPKSLEDEFHPALRHDKSGILSMANSGPNTGDTQFFITTVPTPWLDDKHAIFGQVTKGMDIVRKLENVQTAPGDRPLKEIKMIKVRIAK
jgi:cyclophilin family peptidyl-prolyl cis-trans isomerase